MRRLRMTAKLVAPTNEYSRSSCRRSQRIASLVSIVVDAQHLDSWRAFQVVEDVHGGVAAGAAAYERSRLRANEVRRDQRRIGIGAGYRRCVIVMPDLVCTCAHVVCQALGLLPTTSEAPGEPVPITIHAAGRAATATVERWAVDGESTDLALLRLDRPPGDVAQVTRLLERVPASRRPCVAYGYRAEAGSAGAWVDAISGTATDGRLARTTRHRGAGLQVPRGLRRQRRSGSSRRVACSGWSSRRLRSGRGGRSARGSDQGVGGASSRRFARAIRGPTCRSTARAWCSAAVAALRRGVPRHRGEPCRLHGGVCASSTASTRGSRTSVRMRSSSRRRRGKSALLARSGRRGSSRQTRPASCLLRSASASTRRRAARSSRC